MYKKIIVVAVLIAAVYLVGAYFPVGRKYFLIRFAVQRMASQPVARGQEYSELGEMIKKVQQDTGIILERRNITFERDTTGNRLEVEVDIPVHFPFLEAETSHHFSIGAKDSKLYGEHP